MGIETICCAPLLRMLQRASCVCCVGEDDGALFRRLFNWEHEGSVKCQSGQRGGRVPGRSNELLGSGIISFIDMVCGGYSLSIHTRREEHNYPNPHESDRRSRPKNCFMSLILTTNEIRFRYPSNPTSSSCADSDPQRERHC